MGLMTRVGVVGWLLALLVVCGPGCDPDRTGDDDVGDDDAGDDDAGDDDTGDDDAGDDDTGDDDAGDDDAGDDDAGDDDVGDDDDSASTCGTIGQPCSEDATCSAGESCYLASPTGVCGVGRTICGGFAGADCLEPEAPICMYLQGTDYGLCASADEQVCLCAGSPGVFVNGCGS